MTEKSAPIDAEAADDFYRYSVRRLTDLDYVEAVCRYSPPDWDLKLTSTAKATLITARRRGQEGVFADVLAVNPNCFLMMVRRMDLYQRHAALVDFEDMDALTLVLEGGYATGPTAGAPYRMSAGRALLTSGGQGGNVKRTYDLPRPLSSVVMAGTKAGFRAAAADMDLLGAQSHRKTGWSSGGLRYGSPNPAPADLRHYALGALALDGEGEAKISRYRALLGELILRLPQDAALIDEEMVDPPCTMGLRERQAIEALRRRIEANPEGAVGLDEAARGAGMSRSKLTHLFRGEMGMSLGAFQREMRLRRASSALSQGGVNVTEAASLAGFAEVSSFTRAFRRRFGFPPNQGRPRRG